MPKPNLTCWFLQRTVPFVVNTCWKVPQCSPKSDGLCNGRLVGSRLSLSSFNSHLFFFFSPPKVSVLVWYPIFHMLDSKYYKWQCTWLSSHPSRWPEYRSEGEKGAGEPQSKEETSIMHLSWFSGLTCNSCGSAGWLPGKAAVASDCVPLDIAYLESHHGTKLKPCSSVAVIIERFTERMTLISTDH